MNAGMQLYREGRFEEAAAQFAEAQAGFSAEGNVKDMAEAANNRGVCWRQAARWEEARAAFSEARAVFQSIQNVSGEGQVVGNLGALVDSQGQHAEAAALYEEAIQLLESAGERDLARATYTALSRLKMKQGNWLGALDAYETGLARVEHPSIVQRALKRLLGTPKKLSGG